MIEPSNIVEGEKNERKMTDGWSVACWRRNFEI